MGDKIVIGKNGDEHGIWVAKPGQTVQQGGQMLMSSVQDMLKIHAQGSISSTGYLQSEGLWRHYIELDFPELPFIPLVYMALKTSESEPFIFPPDLSPLATYNGTNLRNLLPSIGMSHNKLYFRGWIRDYMCYFNYTVFLVKLRDKF